MPKKVSFIVTGHKEIDRALRELERKDAAKIIRKALRDNQKKVQKTAKALAPKDTKELSKAIKLKSGKRSNKKIQLFVRQMMPKDSKVPYPFYQEYGSPKRGIKPKAYMRRAFDQHEATVRSDTIKDIQKGVSAWWQNKK